MRDKNWKVRVAVADKGYGLDKLINDKNRRVREASKEQIIMSDSSDIGEKYIEYKDNIGLVI